MILLEVLAEQTVFLNPGDSRHNHNRSYPIWEIRNREKFAARQALTNENACSMCSFRPIC